MLWKSYLHWVLFYAPVYDDQGNQVDNQKCPFSRTPDPESYERGIERIKIRVELNLNDPMAIYNLGIDYRDETCGYSQDYAKALEFWHRAADLGYAAAHCNIGYAYNNGEGVVVDKKKANHYYELAAMGGNLYSRYNLGNNELKAGNVERAVKHFIIAAASGDSGSLNQMKRPHSKITLQHYNPIKHTWERSRVNRGMMLLRSIIGIVTIDGNFSIIQVRCESERGSSLCTFPICVQFTLPR